MRISFSHACTLFCTLVVWTLIAAWVSAEPQQQSPVPAFTVASVKQNLSGRKPLSFDLSPGRFDARSYPLRVLIAVAYQYGRDDYRIVGGPDWLDSARFDIAATFDPVVDPAGRLEPARKKARGERVRAMLQTLLAQRFHLQIHAERRVLSHYALVMARPDEPLHDGIRLSTIDCDEYVRRMQDAPDEAREALLTGELRRCGVGSRHLAGIQTVTVGAMTMPRVARGLQSYVGRMVLDETGLDGRFDMEFTFVKNWAQLPDEAVLGALFEKIGIPMPDLAPSVSVALEDQLGLRLESRQGPVDVHVIDHVERPTPD